MELKQHDVLIIGLAAVAMVYPEQAAHVAKSLLRTAAEHGGTAQKADKGNHQFFSGINVVEGQSHVGQARKADHNKGQQQAGNAPGVAVRSFNGARHGIKHFLNVGACLLPVKRALMYGFRRGLGIGGRFGHGVTAFEAAIVMHVVATTQSAGA